MTQSEAERIRAYQDRISELTGERNELREALVRARDRYWLYLLAFFAGGFTATFLLHYWRP